MSKNRTDNPNTASGKIDFLEKMRFSSLVVTLKVNILVVQLKQHTINLEPNGVSVWD